jgi:hypothetical protein
MHRRNWDSQTKAQLVLQGLKGKPVADYSYPLTEPSGKYFITGQLP